MRALRVLCLFGIFQTIFAIEYQRDIRQILQWKPHNELNARIRLVRQAASGTASRSKRDYSLEEQDIVPTRHAKHRRRRRCRNRPFCSRNVTAITENYGMATSKNLSGGTDLKDISGSAEKITLGSDDNLVSINNAQIDENESSSLLELSKRRELSGTKIGDIDTIDIYDDRPLSDETAFGDSASSWMNIPSTESDETIDENLRSSVYAAIDDHAAIHESLATLLTRLFKILRNTSTEDSRNLLRELNFVDDIDEDPCQKWLNSQDKLKEAFLGPLVSLPACPCQYPSSIFYDDKIWDEAQRRHFRWRDVSGESQRLDVYKPGASYCVRSLLTQGTGSAAAQHCCYDRRRKLLTRGSGAGTSHFVSPEISAVLHEKIDILPWRLCKGDFSRFNKVRPPNNGNGCEANPDDEEYQRQMDDTKYY